MLILRHQRHENWGIVLVIVAQFSVVIVKHTRANAFLSFFAIMPSPVRSVACRGPLKRQDQRTAHRPRLLDTREAAADSPTQLDSCLPRRYSTADTSSTQTFAPPNRARPRERTPTAAGVDTSAACRPWVIRMTESACATVLAVKPASYVDQRGSRCN